MFKQNHRRSCLSAIKEVYGHRATADLLADRLDRVYWSIWRLNEMLLEVIEYHDRVEVGAYVPVEQNKF